MLGATYQTIWLEKTKHFEMSSAIWGLTDMDINAGHDARRDVKKYNEWHLFGIEMAEFVLIHP